MSELREKIEAILQAGDMFLEPPEDMAVFIDKGAIKQSRAEQILAAFKAHIEELDWPKNPHRHLGYIGQDQVLEVRFVDTCTQREIEAYDKAIEAYRKALMESLEEEKGAR